MNCEFCRKPTVFYERCPACEHAWVLVGGNEFILERMVYRAQRNTLTEILNANKTNAD